MDLGATLRQARETKRLTCDQIARATRIPLRMLLAMENNDWAKLPGGIFTRGYLRAYAREVGIDGEPLVAQYESEHAPPPDVEIAAEAPAAATPENGFPEWGRWTWSEAGRRLSWPFLAAALLLALYLTGGRSSPGEDPASSLPASQDVGAGQVGSLGGEDTGPVGTGAQGDATSRQRTLSDDIPLPPPGADVPLAVHLTATRPCWVTVTVDGARTIYRILQPGEGQQAQGREFVIRVGDAGALQLSLDGEPARPLGDPGEVRTVRITRDNYRSLLPPQSQG